MALRYFVNGMVTNNFGDTLNWSLTSGGAGGQTVPTSADDVFFDANSPNCTVNATYQIKTLNFTGYNNTITMSNPIRVFGSITFKAGLLVAGSGALSIEATGTITTNGFTWANAFTFLGTSQVYTFADPCNFSGLTTFSYVSTMTLNGSSTNKLIMAGGLTVTSTTIMTAGTADLNIIGGTWQHTGAGTLVNNLFLNGNVIIGANVYYRTGTLTYTAGSIDTITNNSTLNINNSTTLNTSEMNWNNVSFTDGTTTFSTDLNVLNLTLNGNAAPVLNSNKINVFGNLQVDGTGSITGTSEIILLGNGTWSNSSNAEIKNNLTINASGTIKFGTNVYYSIGTFKYLFGKINAKNSTFNITDAGTTTLINCHKINFDNIKIAPTQTLIMNEFFNGSPLMPTNISSTSISNYTISFQDNFEKIAKFVNIRNCTISRPMQLLVITNSEKSSTNTRGIRYINQSPNGIAKNEPSTLVQTTYGTQMLLSDPAIK